MCALRLADTSGTETGEIMHKICSNICPFCPLAVQPAFGSNAKILCTFLNISLFQ